MSASEPSLLPAPAPPADGSRPDADPRWPAWFAPLSLVSGAVATGAALVIVGIAAHAAGVRTGKTTPALTDISTLLQDAIFVATAVGFASMAARPRPAQFGLRPARLRRTLLWAAGGFLLYWVISVVYVAALHPKEHQTVTRDLGANRGGVALVAGAVLVIVVAPLCEELFFRGFFYRALRSRFGIASAALLDGILFGAVHTGSSSVAVLPVLALLGAMFCVVYERTGTLYATIALHAINNSIAYTQLTHRGAGVAAAFGAAMVVATGAAVAGVPWGRRHSRPA